MRRISTSINRHWTFIAVVMLASVLVFAFGVRLYFERNQVIHDYDKQESAQNIRSAETSAEVSSDINAGKFDGNRAYADVIKQVEFGPRIPGTAEHTNAIEWIVDELNNAGWTAEIQATELLNQPIKNVIGKRELSDENTRPWIILGAHYDTRIYADQDPNPENHKLPVPGANDGASGVAVLLELARTLPLDLHPNVWLVFFDAEDNGRIPGWDWILGSRAFVASLTEKPDAAVIVDMVGDADLNIHFEKNSDLELSKIIWNQAHTLGYGWAFIAEPRYRILDDHIPFLEAGIRAVDLIDFDYEFWHTISDTPDKVTPESLKAVGDTIWHWLQSDSLLE